MSARKPIEQRAKEGNPGKRALPAPLRIGGRAPSPPAGASKEMKAAWAEIVKTVGSFLDSSDALLVETLARAITDARAAEKDIDERGRLVEVSRYGSADVVRLEKNPSVDIARGARMEIRQLCDRFGIGPANRAKLAGLGVVPGRVEDGEPAADDGIAGLGELRVVK